MAVSCDSLPTSFQNATMINDVGEAWQGDFFWGEGYSILTWDWHISVNHVMEGERPREPFECVTARGDARPPLYNYTSLQGYDWIASPLLWGNVAMSTENAI